MEFILHDLAIETTRRCNMQCGHCMRGLSQNIDITPELIDIIFDNKKIKRIDHICFSGGEPTLNPNIIIYTINKIIKENLNVGEIVMVTNGRIFDRELLEAFNRFNEYKNQKWLHNLPRFFEKFGIDDSKTRKNIKEKNNEYVRITFSNDKYHYPIKQEIKDSYHMYSRGIRITEKDIEEKDIYKTGFAIVGKDFNYQLGQLRYCKEGEAYFVIDNIYITATGYATSEGMGQYSDMDQINMGHISDITLEKMLSEYGTPIFNTPKIIYEDVKIKKR